MYVPLLLLICQRETETWKGRHLSTVTFPKRGATIFKQVCLVPKTARNQSWPAQLWAPQLSPRGRLHVGKTSKFNSRTSRNPRQRCNVLLCSFVLCLLWFIFLLNIFNIKHCVNWRYTTSYFDMFIYCNMTAFVAICHCITIVQYCCLYSLYTVHSALF